MFEGVLDQGLQGKGGKDHVQQRRIDIDIDRQSIVETGLLDLQVRIHLVELLGECREVAAALQVLPEKIGKVDQQVLAPHGIDAEDRDDGVQGVEEEVRVDLRLEELQLGLDQQALLHLVPGQKKLVR